MSSIHRSSPSSIANLNSFSAAIVACLVGVLSYFAAMVGVTLSPPGSLSPLWPGCAFLVAVLLCAPRKIWPALMAAGLAGFSLYDLRIGLSVRTTGLLFVADTVEVLVAALGISYALGALPRLNNIKRLAMYSLFAVILAPASGAFVGAAAVGVNYWAMWRIGFFSEALALLTVTPAILGFVGMAVAPVRKSVDYYYEAVLMFVGVVVLGYFIFVASGGQSHPALLYSLVPFLLWSALRYGSVGISTSMLVVAFLSILGTVHARGLFTGSTPVSNVLSLQLFLLVATIPFTTLAALVEGSKEAEHALRESESRERARAKELETVLDALPIAVLIARDSECKRITSNRVGRELLRLRPGANASKSAPSDQQPEFRVLSGGVEVPTEQLPIQVAAATAMHIFDVSESLVFPDGTERSLISNAAPLIGEDGRPYGAVAALLDVTERDRAVKALRESEERFRLAVQAGKMYAYEWDVATDGIVRSGDVTGVLGSTSEASFTRRELLARVHPDDRSSFAGSVSERTPENPETQIIYRVLRPDGSIVWLEKTGRAYFDEYGRMVRMIGMVADITERKAAEEALRESEERFRLVANSAPVMIWMSGLDKKPTYFNQLWLDFTGLSETDLLNGLVGTVHPEDWQQGLDVYCRAFDQRQPFRKECRLRRHDGQYRWMLDFGVPRFQRDGSFAGYIGSCIDVTDQKAAQQTLAGMTRKLIEAQEQERARIARELHDDINQRLAVLAVELDRLHQSNSTDNFHNRLAEAKGRVIEIATDVQALSHQLHSSKLEYLGLAVAAKSFCRELSETHNVRIDFSENGVPRSLPKEIALCLFRVLQEALQNAVKYSGTDHFEVDLCGTSADLRLRVHDFGRGFSVDDAMETHGLGLVSMRERVKSVKGEIVIKSEPVTGTEITVNVPVRIGDCTSEMTSRSA